MHLLLFFTSPGVLAFKPNTNLMSPYETFAACGTGLADFFGFQPWYACLQDKYGEVAVKDINDVFLIIFPIVDSLVKIGGLVAVGVLFYMIFNMVTARGDSGKIKTAVEGMRDAIIGLVIVIISVAVVNFVSGRFTSTPKAASLPSAESNSAQPDTPSAPSTMGSSTARPQPPSQPLTSPPISATHPNTDNTGISPDAHLTVVNGNTTITQSGVYENMDYRGKVTIRASNVTIRNSRISGPSLPAESGCSSSQAQGATYALQVASTATNFVLENSEVKIGNYHRKLNGIGGANMTIRNSEIHGGVDGVGIMGNNIIIENNYIHGLYYNSRDPYHNCTPTHNDAIQIHYGSNITIRNNTLSGKPLNAPQGNAAIMLNQNGGRTTRNVTISNNWADYGTCSFNISENDRTAISRLTITNNKMGKNVQLINGSLCAIIVDTATKSLNSRTISGNSWQDGSSPPPTVFGGN